jgi:hypothetical protein
VADLTYPVLAPDSSQKDVKDVQAAHLKTHSVVKALVAFNGTIQASQGIR